MTLEHGCPPRQEPVRTDRYTKLPDQLIHELTPREHQLVHALLSFRWFDDSAIYPYVGTLAKMLGCHKRTVQRTLRKLEAKGYVVTVAHYRDEAEDEHHGQSSNTYAPGPMLLPLLPHASDQADAPSEQERRTPVASAPFRTNQRNYQKPKRRQQGRYTPPSTGGGYLETRTYSQDGGDFLMTRYGPLKPRT